MTSFCKNLDPDGQPCGVEIEWKPHPEAGKNRPWDVTNNKWHICPYFKPKKNFGQFSQKAREIENEIAGSGQSAFKKTDALGRIAELETQYYSDKKETDRRIGRLEGAVQALVKELSFKKGTEVSSPAEVDEETVVTEE